MTLQEAAAQFAQLEAQYHAGHLPHAQFLAAAAALRAQDSSGAWWQIDPASRAWLQWNGTAWINPAQPQPQSYAPPPYSYHQPQPQSYPPQPPRTPYAAPPQPQAAPGGGSMKGAWEGLISVIPGLAVDGIQRWSVYKENPSMAVGVAAPALLSAILVPLVPKIGKLIPTIVVLACLAWLCWPVIEQWAEISKEAKGVQNQMGRGLVGMSLVYLIPRIWRSK